MIDHRCDRHNLSRTMKKLKPEKNSGLNGIRTHDIWDTGAVFYQVSELSSHLGGGHFVSSYPLMRDGHEYMKGHIFELQRDI